VITRIIIIIIIITIFVRKVVLEQCRKYITFLYFTTIIKFYREITIHPDAEFRIVSPKYDA